MRKLYKPEEVVKTVFLSCIDNMHETPLKENLRAVVGDVEKEAELYDQNGQNVKFFQMTQQNSPLVTNKQLENVYTNKFAKKGQPGRDLYDKLMALPKQGTCPFCGQRVVSTLDHYLPKAFFPLLAVVPVNLVAACSECNKTKLASIPQCEEDQTLHPYYDDVEQEQWLYAEVLRDIPVSLRFFVDPPNGWDDVLKARIKKHFDDLKLGALYASHSGSELSVQRIMLSKVAERGGVVRVREQLQDSFDAYYSLHVNSWQTAMYQALTINDWYCEGGFNNL